jgi:S1-C subfamily serine protease
MSIPNLYSGDDRPAGSGAWPQWLWGIVLLLMAGGAGLWLWWEWRREHPPLTAEVDGAPTELVQPRGSLAEEEQRAEQVYRQAAPSVVHVTLLTLGRDWQTLNLIKIPEGMGSGVIWDKEGHIVTNDHVVADASFALSVTLADHSTWPAKVLARFPQKDLAVLWISAPADRLQPIPLGSAHDLKVGQSAYALGNPFGLDHSLTAGIISALGRELVEMGNIRIRNVIQTSAAINPGNSGGPLLDSAGRMIGITTAILSRSGTWSGIGFAIPVEEVNQAVTQALRRLR